MADSWFNSHTVIWTRKTRGTVTGGSIDDPIMTDAIGFPKSIVGDFQIQTGDRTIQTRGVELRVDAVFFTKETGIQNNDLMAYGGRQYRVELAVPYDGPNNQVDHYEVSLTFES